MYFGCFGLCMHFLLTGVTGALLARFVFLPVFSIASSDSTAGSKIAMHGL